jgi:hypothetical protein
MATYDAIAAVSRTLRTLLLDRKAATGAQVTLAPPDVNLSDIHGARVNLYLFEVLENPHLKNQEIPGTAHPGSYGRPPLSLILRYLLTTYSETETQPDSDINAQSLLGDAMRVLHDFGHRIHTLQITNPAAGLPFSPVLDEVLAGEFERARITLRPVGLDELTKIWSALPEANFRRSVVYELSVVQIETPERRPRPRPVEKRQIIAIVRRRPHILTACVSPVAPTDPIGEMRVRVGDEITIVAEATVADRLYVRLGNLEPIRVPSSGSGEVRIMVPDDLYPSDLDHPATRPIPPGDQLQPGTLEVRLVAEHPADGVEGGLGPGSTIAPRARRRYTSNAAVMQLVPHIVKLSPEFGPASTILEVRGTRLWRPGARSAEVLVGDVALTIRELGGGNPAPLPTAVRIAVAEAAAILPPPAPTGTEYPIAVQIDGARSRDAIFYRLDP